MAHDVNATLQERGTRYGKFTDHAAITQALKQLMRGETPDELSQDLRDRLQRKWMSLEPDQRESLEMNAHKIGRILNGDPDYADSWVDIAGYSKLVADRLEEEQVPHPSGARVVAPKARK